jgi:hypothetical protein
MAMRSNHRPRVYRDPSDGELKATCCCGWSGSPDDIADHDGPPMKEPPLKVKGFVSGLPDRRPR